MKDTRKESLESIAVVLPERRFKVYEAIKNSFDGLSVYDIVALLGWPINCVSGRISELARDKHILDSSRRKVNPGSGKRCVVWIDYPSQGGLF